MKGSTLRGAANTLLPPVSRDFLHRKPQQVSVQFSKDALGNEVSSQSNLRRVLRNSNFTRQWISGARPVFGLSMTLRRVYLWFVLSVIHRVTITHADHTTGFPSQLCGESLGGSFRCMWAGMC